MLKTMSGFCMALIMMLTFGCASSLEEVNRGAEKAGETGGKVLRIPTSVSEGAAKGMAGEPESNPYGR